MVSRHHFTAADILAYGAAAWVRSNLAGGQLPAIGRRGYQVSLPFLLLLGTAPLAIAANALVSAATGAELPNNATITYTTAGDGVSPIDGAGKPTVALVQMANGQTYSVWPLDKPRNLSLIATHGASLIAMTMLVSGFDEFGCAISELFSITATGTSKTATGKKAFKWILSYAFTSAGNATTNTAGVQWGNTFGLRYRITDPNAATIMANGVLDATPTITVADDTAPGQTTGDSRGTFLSSTATDGTKKFGCQFYPSDPSSVAGLFGQVAALNQ